MERTRKQSYVYEIQYQTKMLNNLKRWLRTLLIISSVSFVLMVFGPSLVPAFQPIGLVLLIITMIACVLVNLAIRNGSKNIEKLISVIENK